MNHFRFVRSSALLMLWLCTGSGISGAQEAENIFLDEPRPDASPVVLPAPLSEADLIEFAPEPPSANRFFIDAKSLSVDESGEVRYTLVVKTSGGARNVTYEGLHCSPKERRLYATAAADGGWRVPAVSAWSALTGRQLNAHYQTLARQFFCPTKNVIRSADEGLSALKAGRHPDALAY